MACGIEPQEFRNILLDKKTEGWVQKPWDKEVLHWLIAQA